MNLTPREKDKLLIAMAAEVARKRLARGVKLNYPEAIALITDYVVEGARDGRSVADLMRDGATVVKRHQVIDPVFVFFHLFNHGSDLQLYFEFIAVNFFISFHRVQEHLMRLPDFAGIKLGNVKMQLLVAEYLRRFPFFPNPRFVF